MIQKCNTQITKTQLLTLATEIAEEEHIKILPLMFSPEGTLHVICPCCVLDKRVDLPELNRLREEDPWISFFKRQRAKEHYLDLTNREAPLIEDGFSVRPVHEQTRRFRYAHIDTPIFRDLGFRGHKFDKSIFLPLAIHRNCKTHLRIGFANPELLDEWPLIQRASASWLFRVRSVLPIDVPDLLPISDIGDLVFSHPLDSRYAHGAGKSVQVNELFVSLFKRANKRRYREQAKARRLEALDALRLQESL